MKGKINPFLDEGPGEDTGNSSGKGEEAQMRAQRSPRVIVGVRHRHRPGRGVVARCVVGGGGGGGRAVLVAKKILRVAV